jgi:putative SOS response-associated peptidase YedK
MCGRFVAVSSPTLLAERFAVDEVALTDDGPHYNVAPRALVAVVRERAGEHRLRVLSRLRWGLVPSWADDPRIGDRQINARAETLATRPAFRRAFERRRCIVAADGFYEWQKIEVPGARRARRQPYFVHRRDGEPMAFAGLWEVWKVPESSEPVDGAGDDGWLRTCAIVTTRANDRLLALHDRMPVILPERAWDAWLDRENRDVDGLASVLGPAPDDWLDVYPVSTLVSRADNDGPELVRRLEPGGADGTAGTGAEPGAESGEPGLTLFS